VVHSSNSSYAGSTGRRIAVQGQAQTAGPYPKKSKNKAVGLAQVVSLASIMALSSTPPVLSKKKKTKKPKSNTLGN
jgi:hypothetical protein